MAQAIGREKEAADYLRLFGSIKAAFNRKYVKPDGSLTVDTQTAYVLALDFNLVPSGLRAAAGNILADKLRRGETADNSGMATGFLGTRALLPVLSSVGEYEVEQGATTIWERWNSYTKDKGFGGEQNASMNSFAHYSFGAVCEWMFDRLAGIDQNGPGWQRILLRPSPPSPRSNAAHEPINWVKAHYDSIRGRIESNWRLAGDRFELEATIPANTTATVYLPSASADTVTVGGRKWDRTTGVRFLSQEGDRTVLAVESGRFRFGSQVKP
jgi:alpha-L-rhamnosidase